MKTIQHNNWSLICYDSFGYENKPDLKEFITSWKIEEILEWINEKIIIVLGWDWTILRAVRENYQKNMPFLGLNFGSKWFLLNDKNCFSKDFKYTKREYPLIETSISNWEQIDNLIALNEVDIRANSWRWIEVNIWLKAWQNIDLAGDWLIVSSPAGSTGYNSSLWWPIIPHTMDAFVITPKAPWKPRWQAPILLPDNEEIIIKNINRLNSIWINIDWNEVKKTLSWENIEINITKSKQKVELIIDQKYINIWDSKVLADQWFNT